jgi:hypothetical protein
MEFFKKLFNHKKAQKRLNVLSWGNELAAMDDISAIEYSIKKFNDDSKLNIFQDDQYLDAFFAIDEKTHIIVERITEHYINIGNMSIELEERIANAVFLYHRQLFLIYCTLIENLAPFQPQSLLMMLVRAINNATKMVKWRYFNYQSAPANVWLQLSKLYLTAEKQGILDTYVRIYGNKEITTISSAYIQACMLGSLESLSFQRKQIDLVSQMLTYWTPKILIQKTYDENKHLFYVDTARDVPAKRIRNYKPIDSHRYWCFDSVNLKVELCLSLIEYNITPKQQEMKNFISNKFALATLEILRNEWSKVEYKRQRRGEDRVKTTKYATTTFGFEDTCYHIKQHENAQLQNGERSYQGSKSFDERLASHYVSKNYDQSNVIYLDLGAGQSKIIDESTNGIGLYINKAASEVSLGMMVGVSISDQKMNTKVGMIRSIKPVLGNELHIGIEILSTLAMSIEAKNMNLQAYEASSVKSKITANASFARYDLNEPVKLDDYSANFTCLYLPSEFSLSKQESIIIPRLHYSKNDSYKIIISGTEKLVKFTNTLENHDNWLRVEFTQINEIQLAA